MTNKVPVSAEKIIEVIENYIAIGKIDELRQIVRQKSIMVDVEESHKKQILDHLHANVTFAADFCK